MNHPFFAFVVAVYRNNKGLLFGEVGCVFDPVITFLAGFEDEFEFAMFEVTDAPMEEFGASARGARPDVPFVDEDDAIATAGELAGGACAVDACTDDGHIDVDHSFSSLGRKMCFFFKGMGTKSPSL
jgi:hypothetical protein